VSKEAVVDIEGKHLKLSNLDKVLYPAAGFTKGQVIDYYVRIAPVLVPHIAGHPLTLKRYPEGVDHPFFFEKNAAKHRPDWVKTAPIWNEGNNRERQLHPLMICQRLVWWPTWLPLNYTRHFSLAKDIDCPTMMVFDLTPVRLRTRAMFASRHVAKDDFDHFGLQSFSKTSGSKGLQIYVPLHTPTSYDVTKPFATRCAITGGCA